MDDGRNRYNDEDWLNYIQHHKSRKAKENDSKERCAKKGNKLLVGSTGVTPSEALDLGRDLERDLAVVLKTLTPSSVGGRVLKSKGGSSGVCTPEI